MKNLSFAFIFLLGISGYAQSVMNDYKYVIVPKQFEGFRSENQYQTSTLVKFYLSKQGIPALYDDALPEELNSNRCTALYTSLDDQSSMFTTRLALVFKDCEGVERFRTQEGSSKVKDFKEAYREAIGEAFKTLKDYQYQYRQPKDNQPVVLNFKDDVKKLPPKPEPPTAPEKTETEITEVLPAAQDKEETALMPLPVEEMEEVTLEDAVSQDKEEEKVFPSALYAQKTETGYQLVDTTPSIQFYLQETSLPNVFLAKRKGQNGILFLENDRWVFEYYEGSDRIQEELQIKF